MPVMCGSIFASKTFTGIVPVTGTVKLPVMLQCRAGAAPEPWGRALHLCYLCLNRVAGLYGGMHHLGRG